MTYYDPNEDKPDDTEWMMVQQSLPCGTQSSKLNTVDQFTILIERLTIVAKKKRRTILWNTVELSTEYETFEYTSFVRTEDDHVEDRFRVFKVGAWTTPWKSSTEA